MSEVPPGRPQGTALSHGIMPMVMPMVVGLVVGAAASWALLFRIDRAAPWAESLLDLVLPALGVVGAALVLVVPLTWWLVRRTVRRAHGTLEEVVRQVTAATQAAAERDAPTAASHAEGAVLEALAWYGPIAARRWVVRTALGLLVGFGGLIGTALLFRQTVLLGKQNEKLAEQTELMGKQNEKLSEQTVLLKDQNDKIDLQTVTAEAQRRGALTAELFAILQTISLIETTAASSDKSAEKDLPRGLKARILAFSRAAAPYRIVEISEATKEPRLADRSRSPERGQLLVGLSLAGIKITGFEGLTFQGADLRRANLASAHLNGADLTEAVLTEANLTGANLTEADLASANLASANLTEAVLTEANLDSAHLNGADLTGANLTGANLTRANLTHANLIRANLTKANLAQADLSNVIVGFGVSAPGQLPEKFPEGWKTPPPGWEMFGNKDLTRLRRSGTP